MLNALNTKLYSLLSSLLSATLQSDPFDATQQILWWGISQLCSSTQPLLLNSASFPFLFLSQIIHRSPSSSRSSIASATVVLSALEAAPVLEVRTNRRSHTSPWMDSGSAGSAAGIDPKIINNWQQGAFAIKSCNQPEYNQQPEWDSSQDSSRNHADIMDQSSLHAPLGLEGSLFTDPNDYLNVDNKYDLLILELLME